MSEEYKPPPQLRAWERRYTTWVKATCTLCGYVQNWDEPHWCDPKNEEAWRKKVLEEP
jgi:hypothetical protein